MSSDRFLLYIVAVLVLAPGLIKAGALREAVEQAVASHELSRAATLSVQEAELSRQVVARVRYPRLSMIGSWDYVSDVPEISIDLPPTLPVTLDPIAMGTHHQWATGARVDWLLYDGGRNRAQVRMAESGVVMKNLEREKTRRDLSMSVIRLWRAFQARQLALQALDSGVKQLELRQGQLRALLKEELAIPLDTLELAILQQEMRQQKLSLQADTTDLGQRLNTLVGKRVLPSTGNFSRTIKEPLQADVANLPEIRQTVSAMNVAGEKEKEAASGRWPQVYMQGNILYGRPGTDAIADEWMGWGTAGIKFSWDLYDGGMRRNRMEEARVSRNRVRLQREAAIEQAQLKFDEMYRTLQLARDELALYQQRYQLARERMEILQAQLNQEQISRTEYSIAVQELVAAEIAVSTQQVKLLLQESETEYASGKDWEEWHYVD